MHLTDTASSSTSLNDDILTPSGGMSGLARRPSVPKQERRKPSDGLPGMMSAKTSLRKISSRDMDSVLSAVEPVLQGEGSGSS